VTGHGEPVEPCAGYSLGNDSHAQLFMTLCIVLKMPKNIEMLSDENDGSLSIITHFSYRLFFFGALEVSKLLRRLTQEPLEWQKWDG
jgi:hypothetical protein